MTESTTVRTASAEAAASPAQLILAMDPRALADFLVAQRWFGAKGQKLRRVAVQDVVPVESPGVRAAIARVLVELESGRVIMYQLPIALRTAGTDPTTHLIANVEGDGWQGALVDATGEREFRRLVAEGFVEGASYSGDRSSWIIRPEAGAPVSGLADAKSRAGSAEQSNSSVFYGDRAMLKMYRRLEGGEQPDVEMARFLTGGAGFPHTPTLLGTIRLEDAAGTATIAGMLQSLVANASDAWSVALADARSFLKLRDAGDARPEFADIALRLGAVTRRLHEALSSDRVNPAFAPVAATAEDVIEWAARVRVMILETTALLDERHRAGTLPNDTLPIAGAVAARRTELLAHLDAVAAAAGSLPGERIRHHGDFHLGQVLIGADDDIYIIDFEGEPLRPLAERRAKHSALRDVAGMLRSFSYAPLVVAREEGGLGTDAELERSVARWERDARETFLEGYLADGTASFLPADRDGALHLITLFEMEKVFYELAYELGNRPDWVWIPLRGIGRMLGAARPVRRT